MYGFDVSGYENKSFRFYVKCVEKHGDSGSLKVYLINDTGALKTILSNMSYVCFTGLKLDTSGEKIAAINPLHQGNDSTWVFHHPR
ncbi:MAG TPA: hypothetical protein EYP23_06190 [Thermoplasmata archaeon]|nr:hypothetical protein [Thermoplasmata archaeon]